MPDPSQFNTDGTYPGRWTVTFNNPPINMFVPSTIVELGALMTDLEADPSVKVVVFQWLGEPHAGRWRPRLVCRGARPPCGLVRP
jgi:enoyl-CoA hydratase/carnithine racemase